MLIDFGHRYGEVYGKNEKGTCKVKVSFPEVGLYVNGIKVVASKRAEGELKVYPPAYRVGNEWKQHFEFSRNSELWKLIEEEAIKAVNESQVVDYFDDRPLTVDDFDGTITPDEKNNRPP